MKITGGQAAIDIGNDSLKAIFGNGSEQMLIPNLVAEMASKRSVKEIEKDIFDGIHVEIISDALKNNRGVYAVGNLARQQHNYSELAIHSRKMDNDQTLILLLTALATHAAQSGNYSNRDELIEAKYILSTGLPMIASLEERKLFRDKIQRNTHEIKFLETPLLQGKTIRISFEKVFVNLEGLASFINLSKKDEDLVQQELMIFDIGALTTDVAVIGKKATVNNTISTGYSEGISIYLDRIINRVRNEIGYPIKTRRDIVDIITNENTQDKNQVYLFGNRVSISHIVDEELTNFARKQYTYMLDVWNKVPSIRYCYFVGGGAIVLKEYIQSIMNMDSNNLPIRFLSTNDSIWSICESYFSILETWYSKQQKERMYYGN